MLPERDFAVFQFEVLDVLKRHNLRMTANVADRSGGVRVFRLPQFAGRTQTRDMVLHLRLGLRDWQHESLLAATVMYVLLQSHHDQVLQVVRVALKNALAVRLHRKQKLFEGCGSYALLNQRS